METTEAYFKEMVADRARAAGIIPSAVPDAVLFCENAVANGETATIQEILEARKADRPHWFQPSSGGGASGGSSSGGTAKSATGKPISEMSKHEKVAFIRQNGYDKFSQKIMAERR